MEDGKEDGKEDSEEDSEEDGNSELCTCLAAGRVRHRGGSASECPAMAVSIGFKFNAQPGLDAQYRSASYARPPPILKVSYSPCSC